MFGKSKGNAADTNRDSSSVQDVKRSIVGHSAAPGAASSISSGLSIVGKIVGEGTLEIFGHVEGEVHASTVQIGDGAKVEGNIVADELTIGGRVKGTIHANRVKLNSTAVVEGDIYHRSLAIEENAQFEGMSRRQETLSTRPRSFLETLTGARHQRQWTRRRHVGRPQSIAGAGRADRSQARGNTSSNVPNP